MKGGEREREKKERKEKRKKTGEEGEKKEKKKEEERERLKTEGAFATFCGLEASHGFCFYHRGKDDTIA
jgi:hypothetical protein